MAPTPNRQYPTPSPGNTVAEEFYALQQQTLLMIDGDVQYLVTELESKADAGHPHGIDDVSGLRQVLDALAPGEGASVRLATLPDVQGVLEAPDGYVLIKQGNYMIAMSAIAALGDHQHQMAQIAGLADALSARLTRSGNLGNIENPVTARRNLRMWDGTQAQYDAITTKDAQTIYFIT